MFDAGFSPADLERGRARGDASFHTLASVRQLFAVNARLAWLTVSAFDEAWELETVPPPWAHFQRKCTNTRPKLSLSFSTRW
ncbi:hypothetical protein SAMN04489730_7312 [Amycolatopsis australiensis]|uniref:Uncharacterized protein n=1 Tax=Amycolatopsis australiensis TaxID=546364 RepID=A0A1K1SZC7_9PSEU|nr:hypothetical protein SAMN04489730_7312 [Amycolatopsis australiensis]